MGRWVEIGADVFVRRYEMLDLSIGVIIGGEAVLVVDTLTSVARARALFRAIHRLTSLPVAHVVNTHAHVDHVLGNAAFPEATIWAQRRMPAVLRSTAASGRAWLRAAFPDLGPEIDASPIVEPTALVDRTTMIDLGDRPVQLLHVGRGHTDHDLVVRVPDATVLFAGDLIETGAPPAFEDAFPRAWAATLDRLAALPAMAGGGAVVVPGHGDPAGADLLIGQAALHRTVADLAARVDRGELDADAAAAAVPLGPMNGPMDWPGDGPGDRAMNRSMARIAIERGLLELRAR